MRLTLRTLLAYRDGVLSAADREDLHRRIQQSEDAGNLLKRVNATASRIYGASPTIVGKGLGGDPNSLAEYLDDVLISEKVPELERICLESDAYLAELASCHTLLSTAMNTRINVPNSLRQLAVDIGAEDRRAKIKEEFNSRKHSDTRRSQIIRADSAHPTNGQANANAQVSAEESREHVVQVPVPMVATGGDTIKQRGLNLEGSQLTREVPEYLVGKNDTSWLIPLAIGGLIALLGVRTWKSLGPLDRIQELFSTSGASQNAPSNTSSALPTSASSNATGSTESKGSADVESVDAGIAASDAFEEEPAPIIESEEMPPGVAPAAGEQGSMGNATPPIAESASTAHERNIAENTELADSTVPENLDRPVDATVSSPTSANAAESDSAQNASTLALSWDPPEDAESEAVILVNSSAGLRQLASGGSLGIAEKLIFPPNYRTTFELSNGVRWTACGPTLLSIEGSNPDAVNLQLGRALLQSVDAAATKANTIIDTPVGRFAIRFSSQDSLASIEVEYRRKAYGALTDPNAFAPVWIVTAVNGQVAVVDTRNNSETTLNLGEGIAVVNDARGRDFKLQTIPDWFRRSYQGQSTI